MVSSQTNKQKKNRKCKDAKAAAAAAAATTAKCWMTQDRHCFFCCFFVCFLLHSSLCDHNTEVKGKQLQIIKRVFETPASVCVCVRARVCVIAAKHAQEESQEH